MENEPTGPSAADILAGKATGGTDVTAAPAPAAPTGDAAPSLLNQTPEATATETPATEEPKQEEDSREPTGAPEAYEDFTLPEGIEVDAARADEFKAVAKELNLTQAQAQKLVDIQATREAQAAKAQAEAWTQLRADWEGKVKADPEIGGKALGENLAHAKKALDRFGTPALRDALEMMGWGSHPEMVRFVARVGRELGEGSMHGGGSASAPAKPLHYDLYPTMRKEG